MNKAKQRIDAQKFAALVKQARDAVVKDQRVSYNFLGDVLKVKDWSLVKRIMHELSRLGIVAQNQRRFWVVLIGKDGEHRKPPKPPKHRVIRRNRPSKRKGLSARAAVPARAKPIASGRSLKAQKLRLLSELIARSGPHNAKLLKAIAADVESAETAGQLANVLRD